MITSTEDPHGGMSAGGRSSGDCSPDCLHSDLPESADLFCSASSRCGKEGNHGEQSRNRSLEFFLLGDDLGNRDELRRDVPAAMLAFGLTNAAQTLLEQDWFEVERAAHLFGELQCTGSMKTGRQNPKRRCTYRLAVIATRGRAPVAEPRKKHTGSGTVHLQRRLRQAKQRRRPIGQCRRAASA